MSNERNELEAAYALRDKLQSNYLVRSGPKGKVPEGSDCWIWQGACQSGGYGTVRFGGFTYVVHRLIWVFENGPIPVDLEIRHACDRPSCIRLDHLSLGTHTQNMQDMWDRGRANPPIGSRHGCTSLSENDVENICHLVVNERKSYGLVANMFGATKHAVRHIALGQSWDHVSGPLQTSQKYTKHRFKGVNKRGERWEAWVRDNGRTVYLGSTFDTELSAAIARNEWEVSKGRQPSNIIPELPEWSTPVLEELTPTQWEEMQRGPGEWVTVLPDAIEERPR